MENPLEKIINIEITVDQACAIMSAIDCALKENDEWLGEHQDSDGRQDVEQFNKLLKDAGFNITHEMQHAWDDKGDDEAKE